MPLESNQLPPLQDVGSRGRTRTSMSGLTIRRPAIERHEIDLRGPYRCRTGAPGRRVPHRGLDPLQAGLKDRSPSRRAHEASVSWPPRNRTGRYLFIRQDPSTSWVVASGRRRAEQSKPTAGAAHSLAARPGTYPVHSPCLAYRPRDSNPDPPRSERAPLASWARAAWSGYRESDPGFHHGEVALCH